MYAARSGKSAGALLRAWVAFFLALCLLMSSLPAARGEAAEAPVPTAEVAVTPLNELLRLHQINIQTGAAWMLTVGDLVVLIDCGSDTLDDISARHINRPLMDYLEASGIDHVDAHFVTHWHNDHCYNVDILAEKYGTEHTVVYGVSPKLHPPLDPLPVGTYRQLTEGTSLTLGPLEIFCFGPPWRDPVWGNRNMDSMNLVIRYGDISIGVTGDYIWAGREKYYGDQIRQLDILLFPHHGIWAHEVPVRTYGFMDPRLVLIPGVERGGARTVARKAGANPDAVFLCYQDGHVLVTSDGSRIWYAAGVEPGTFPLGTLLPPRPSPAP
ncbi:MAG: MBL fold metallo-hydrolase [Clostridia bacterium]|nr:MBL fold metallo-hydrolase [Clostridia bacterium]